jgi:hypothetical protein
MRSNGLMAVWNTTKHLPTDINFDILKSLQTATVITQPNSMNQSGVCVH